MRSILGAGQRSVAAIEPTRQENHESYEAYTARLESALRASGAQAVWLCVPPGRHVVAMVGAAIASKLHVVAEKPWLCSLEETKRLSAAAQHAGIQIGVHFEYCLLDEIEAWRQRYRGARGRRFGGEFSSSRPERFDMSPLENFGSHLLAIRRYAAPEAEIAGLVCAYERADARRVWLDHESVDFVCNRQPVIQRFVKKFEASIDGAELPFGLEFASAVAEDLAKWRARQTAESLRP